MKVNRFGMSQKIFCDMAIGWVNTQNYIAQALRHNGARDDALKTLFNSEEFIKKVFLDDEPDKLREHRQTLVRLRNEITLELSAQD